MHTNLDRSAAARTLLPELMGFTASSSLEFVQQPDLLGLGAVADIAQTNLAELASRASRIFHAAAGVGRTVRSHLKSSFSRWITWRFRRIGAQGKRGCNYLRGGRLSDPSGTSQYVALTYCCLAMTAQKSHSWKSWQKAAQQAGVTPASIATITHSWTMVDGKSNNH